MVLGAHLPACARRDTQAHNDNATPSSVFSCEEEIIHLPPWAALMAVTLA